LQGGFFFRPSDQDPSLRALVSDKPNRCQQIGLRETGEPLESRSYIFFALAENECEAGESAGRKKNFCHG